MRDYRMYSLDRWGRIGFSEDIKAENDEAALRLAQEINSKSKKCELWEGRRLVAAFTGQEWELDPA